MLVNRKITYICRCNKFCQTALSSTVGVRRMMQRLFGFLRGVRLRSGPQCTVGLLAAVLRLPGEAPGSTMMRNSFSEDKKTNF